MPLVLQVLLPTESIICTVVEHVRPVDQQIENLYRQTTKLVQARDILLPRLMNGEVTI
jgi:type I restriction enzyme S subunit